MHRLALAGVVLVATACTSGGGDTKPSPSAVVSSSPPQVAATLHVTVPGASRDRTQIVATLLSGRLNALGDAPVTTTVDAGSITFGLPRGAKPAEVEALRAPGRLTIRPVLSISAPTGCATVHTAADDERLVACDKDATTSYVLGPAALTGADVRSAYATEETASDSADWVVQLTMKSAAKWGAVTEKYVGTQIAIVLDGVVQSAPTVQEKIPDGEAAISGKFTEDQARALAPVMKYGALPSAVTIP
jgi:preprotein translocase subunit SecD